MRKTLALAALLLAACGTAENDAPPADTTAIATDTAPAPAPAATVTDPQIAAIVVAANQVDVTAGEMAAERATDERVKAFAQRMITDHNGVNRAASELVGRLGVTPEPNATSEKLLRDGELAREAIGRETGAAFDRAYMDNEVSYHEAVLQAIDGTLIPGAQNAELRQLLEQTRPAVDAHLQQAREIQAALGAS